MKLRVVGLETANRTLGDLFLIGGVLWQIEIHNQTDALMMGPLDQP